MPQQQDTRFTARIAVDPLTQRKVQILRAVRFYGYDQIGAFVEGVVEDAWQEALHAGMVNEKMLKEMKNKKAVAG